MKNKEILDFVNKVISYEACAKIYDFKQMHKEELTEEQFFFLTNLFVMLSSLNSTYRMWSNYGKD